VSFIRPIPAKSFSVSQVNLMLGRIYSIALTAIMLEAFANGFVTLQFLNKPIFFGSVAIYFAAVLGVVASQWFIKGAKFWLQSVAIVVYLGLITWPLHFNSAQDLPPGFQPWIWWTLGIAMVAGGASFRFSIGVFYLVSVPVIWFFLKISPEGGSTEPIVAMQDSLHLFLLPTILVTMVLALRWEASKVDSANQLAIASAVEGARIEAIELERSRLEALVHDRVLTTLVVAAKANTQQEKEVAAKSAKDALSSLDGAANYVIEFQQVTLNTFFTALQTRIQSVAPTFLVTIDRLSDLPIRPEVAEALTEATLQAVDNSLKHASDATSREVRLRGQIKGLKIVVSDNGNGFWPKQVPRDRMGLRTSIISRVESVGGKVFLNTRPGTGTTIVMEWSQSG
jgi:signal transduction histidine kinase